MDLRELGPQDIERLLLGKGTRKPKNKSWKRILEGDPCVYCGRRGVKRTKPQRKSGVTFANTMTIDHILPLPHPDRGWLNQTSSCGHCNKIKKEVPLLFFLLKEYKRVPTCPGL